MRGRVQKWGNSLAIRIPKPIAKDSNIDTGSVVELRLVKGSVVITPVEGPVYSLQKLLAAISDENRHGEIDTGEAVGLELL